MESGDIEPGEDRAQFVDDDRGTGHGVYQNPKPSTKLAKRQKPRNVQTIELARHRTGQYQSRVLAQAQGRVQSAEVRGCKPCRIGQSQTRAAKIVSIAHEQPASASGCGRKAGPDG